jgi:hypothetical protein
LIYKAFNVDEYEKEKQKIIKISQLSTEPVVIPKILQLDHDDIISNANEFKEHNEYIIGEDGYENEFETNNNNAANVNVLNDDDDDFNNDNGTEYANNDVI